MSNFEKWLNYFCIDNFHFSYRALIEQNAVKGKVVEKIVNAIQVYYIEMEYEKKEVKE